MSIYLTPIPWSLSPKTGERYMVAFDAEYQVNERTIIVPAGFEFDGASIPPFLWPIIGSPFDPRFVRAALLHDWIYSSHVLDRKAADLAFRQILEEDDVGSWRVPIMYRAVRAGGVLAWDDSPQDVAYMAYLRQSIVDDGRDPTTYGLHA